MEARARANIVFPVPGGPQRITEESLSVSISARISAARAVGPDRRSLTRSMSVDTSGGASRSARRSNCAGATAANYAIRYYSGDLLINQAGLTITANDETKAFGAALRGATFERFDRWGKYLLIGLSHRCGASAASRCVDTVEGALVVHLRMSGQLRLAGSIADPVAKHCHVVLTFSDGRQLRFVDPRTFGEMFVTDPTLPELAGLGVDALGVTLERFERVHAVIGDADDDAGAAVDLAIDPDLTVVVDVRLEPHAGAG